MQELRNVTTVASRRPTHYSIEPQPDQHILVTFDARPATGESVDALVSLLPASWGTEGDPPTIPFSTRALRALERKVAAEVGMALNAEDLNRIKVNPAVFAVWAADAKELLRQERLAVSRLRLDHGPTDIRWALAWRNT
jgi:hypothetical protein